MSRHGGSDELLTLTGADSLEQGLANDWGPNWAKRLFLQIAPMGHTSPGRKSKDRHRVAHRAQNLRWLASCRTFASPSPRSRTVGLRQGAPRLPPAALPSLALPGHSPDSASHRRVKPRGDNSGMMWTMGRVGGEWTGSRPAGESGKLPEEMPSAKLGVCPQWGGLTPSGGERKLRAPHPRLGVIP